MVSTEKSLHVRSLFFLYEKMLSSCDKTAVSSAARLVVASFFSSSFASSGVFKGCEQQLLPGFAKTKENPAGNGINAILRLIKTLSVDEFLGW